MQLFRRSAFRALNSTISTPRTIVTRTPFAARTKAQPLSAILFRRFASNDVGNETQEPQADTESSSSTPSSADQDDSSSIKSAIDSATESASTYASDAAESISETYESAKDSVTDYAQAAGAAAGFSAPRSGYEDRRPRRGDDRQSGGMQSRDRRPPLQLTPNPSIYIGNLLFDCTEADLQEEFSKYGTVKNVKLATDHRGLSKGFGYVEFATTEEATSVIEAKHLSSFHGRTITVNYQNTTRRPQELAEPSKTLFIGNLAFEMSDADLNQLFRDIRNVVDVRVAIDRRTGQPRGFAHAEFTDVESAQKGMEALKGQEIFGRRLRLDYSGGGLKREGGRGGDRGDRGGYGGRDGGRSGGYGGDRGGERY